MGDSIIPIRAQKCERPHAPADFNPSARTGGLDIPRLVAKQVGTRQHRARKAGLVAPLAETGAQFERWAGGGGGPVLRGGRVTVMVRGAAPADSTTSVTVAPGLPELR
jgi:hypothetical protein